MSSPRPQESAAVDQLDDGARSGPRLTRRLSAFKHRNYRLFFIGQLLSVTGTWMQSLAQAWLVLTMTDSALQFSLVNVCQFAPVLLFSIPGGVIADRFPKRTVLLITQSAAGLLAVTLAILVATDTVALWHVYALALGLGTVNAIDMPTRQAFVSEMVDREDLMNAIALNSTVFNTGRIIGPAIAGVVYAWQGPALCFALNAFSYLAVIGGLLAMRLKRSATAREGTGLQRMREGLAFIRATPVIMMPVTLIAIVATFGLNFNIWIPLLAKKEFDLGADGFGVLISAIGIGSLAGALFLAFSGRGARPRQLLMTAVVLGFAELVLAALAAAGQPIVSAFLVLPVMGFAMTCTNAMANTVVQSASPQALRGRIMSVYMISFAGTAPLGAFLAGGVAQHFSTPASIALGGSVTLAATVLIALHYGILRPDAPALSIPSMMAEPVHSGSRD
jgi:MFS family permease